MTRVAVYVPDREGAILTVEGPDIAWALVRALSTVGEIEAPAAYFVSMSKPSIGCVLATRHGGRTHVNCPMTAWERWAMRVRLALGIRTWRTRGFHWDRAYLEERFRRASQPACQANTPWVAP